MTNFESLDETFDIVQAETVDVTPVKKGKPLVISDKDTDKEKDYQYARAQLYDIVEKMQETLNGALEVAQQSDHPRAYEVAFNGARNAADVVEKLQDLHKKTKDLEIEEAKVTQNNNTTNQIFMSGSTAELIKMLKDNK